MTILEITGANLTPSPLAGEGRDGGAVTPPLRFIDKRGSLRLTPPHPTLPREGGGLLSGSFA